MERTGTDKAELTLSLVTGEKRVDAAASRLRPPASLPASAILNKDIRLAERGAMGGLHITILSGSMGGHPRIAQALTAALGQAAPDATVETVDLYAPGFISLPLARTTGAYEQVVAASRNTWRMVFHLSNQPAIFRLIRRMGTRLTRRDALEAALNRQPPSPEGRPDVLVRVISDLGQEAHLARRAQRLPPIVTVVSDLVTVHRGWLSPETTLYALPTDEAYAACRRMGVPEHKLRVLGFPIRSELFCGPEAASHPPAEPFRVLMMGGSSGSGRIAADVRRLVDSRLRLHLTVVAGRNQRLLRRLEKMQPGVAPGARLEVLGYTEDIPALMRQAHVLITKAGPSTLYEAAACGLPAIINSHLPGQESGNADFFVKSGVALNARRPRDTLRLVRALMDDRPRLRAMRNPALAERTCQAAARIAEAILEAART
jgi:1,2-diacylglycerol 3-beta-galactosyltransferase